MKILERAGYTVTRTAGSHGPFDVIAWRRTDCRYCQVKIGETTKLEREKVQIQELPDCCTRELWTWTKQGNRWLHRVEIFK